MRQAGRSLPEYRALRATGSILDAIADPAVAAEVTLQPVRRYGVDAAILFSDIVVPYHALGFGVDVVPGRGPVISRALRDELGPRATARPRRLRRRVRDATTVDLVVEALRASNTPLIGFAGAPFTVASYLVEGAPTREFASSSRSCTPNPQLFDQLMERLADITITFLRVQINHGARAVPALRLVGRLAHARRVRALRAARDAARLRRASPTSTSRRSSSASAPANCSD